MSTVFSNFQYITKGDGKYIYKVKNTPNICGQKPTYDKVDRKCAKTLCSVINGTIIRSVEPNLWEILEQRVSISITFLEVSKLLYLTP